LTQAAKAVCRVRDRRGVTWGTGFLARLDTPRVRGVVCITATHVVEAIRGPVNVSFDAGAPPASWRNGPLWQSGVEALDITIYGLATGPEGAVTAQHEKLALNLAAAEPPEWIALPGGGRRHPRVFPIGHPRGGPLSISIEDNLLEGTKSPHGTAWRRFLHYRAATEPGSSGGPVLSEDLEVVAVHRAGGDTMQSFAWLMGRRQVNEGTSAAALLEALGRGRER
jgi:hypothetical protein